MEKVLGQGHTISKSVTRPSDTTAYTAGDVVGNGATITFAGAARRSGESGVIQQAIIFSSAYVATAPDLELWLFDTTITADADNATFTPTDAELATLIGIIEFPTADWHGGDLTAGVGGNHVCCVQNIGMPFNATGNDSAIYGVLVTRNAYVPISAEVFTVRLQILD